MKTPESTPQDHLESVKPKTSNSRFVTSTGMLTLVIAYSWHRPEVEF